MNKAKRGLGKGFDSLIPTQIQQEFDPTTEEDKAKSRVKNVFISDIKPNPDQPRRDFEPQALKELTDSIKQHGVLQPVVVVAADDGFILIAGERRWRAAQAAGLKQIPAIVRTLDAQAQLEVALIENLQREDLTPLEMATALVKLNQQFNQTFEAIAERLGKAHTTVINTTRLLQLPDTAKRALQKGRISEGHARQILALKHPKQQQELLDYILRHHWSVRRAEQFVTALKEGAVSGSEAVKQSRQETEETRKLSKHFKTDVKLQPMAKGGRIIIGYKTTADLKRLLKKLLASK